MGGWPVIEGDSWDESKFDWLDTLISYRKNGFSHDLFMDLSVTPDFRNNTRHVIDVSNSVPNVSLLCARSHRFLEKMQIILIFSLESQLYFFSCGTFLLISCSKVGSSLSGNARQKLPSSRAK
jgi:hypothetical protein